MSSVRYPCTDSNCALRLRRPTLCPLSYRGGWQEEHLHFRADFIIQLLCHTSTCAWCKCCEEWRSLAMTCAYALALGPNCESSARKLSMILKFPPSSPIFTSCSFLWASSPQTGKKRDVARNGHEVTPASSGLI